MIRWVFISLVLACTAPNATSDAIRKELVPADIYVVPTNFSGRVVVVYDSTRGQPAVYSGKSRLFEIPTDGFLWTKHGLDSSEMVEIPQIYRGTILPDNRIDFIESGVAIEPNDVVATMPTSGMTMVDNETRRVVYSQFYVGTEIAIDSAMRPPYRKRIEELMIAH